MIFIIDLKLNLNPKRLLSTASVYTKYTQFWIKMAGSTKFSYISVHNFIYMIQFSSKCQGNKIICAIHKYKDGLYKLAKLKTDIDSCLFTCNLTCPRVERNKIAITLMDSSTPHTQNSLLSEVTHFQTTSKSCVNTYDEQPIILTHTHSSKVHKLKKTKNKIFITEVN